MSNTDATNFLMTRLKQVCANNTITSDDHNELVKKRNSFVDRIYADYARSINAASRISLSEFRKFEILYSRAELKRYMDGQMSDEELENIERLSTEFISRVPPKLPIHIIDDHTGEEIAVLPPLFTSTNLMDAKSAMVIDELSNAIIHDDGQRGSISGIKIDNGIRALFNSLMAAQNRSDIIDQINATDKLANELHEKHLGSPIYKKPVNMEQEKKKALETQDENIHPENDFF